MDNNNQWHQQPYNNGMQQNYNMGAQQTYNMNMQTQYGVQYQRDKKGLSVAALVIGILSIILCCCLGWLPGLIGIIIAIIALVKEPKGKGMAITGLILSIVSLGISILCMFITLDDNIKDTIKYGSGPRYDIEDDYEYEYNDDYDEDYDDNIKDEHFWGSKYTSSDDSVIYFYSDGTFEWFLTDYDYDNVKTGTYEVMFGEDAREWIVEDHTEYGVTNAELLDYWDRNSDSDLYTKENLTILILTTDVAKMDGEQQNDKPYTVNYYGYSNELGFDGVNLSTFNYMTLYNEY